MSQLKSASWLLTNALLLDPVAGELSGPVSVAIENGRIADIGPSLSFDSAETVPLDGQTLMPGLIDCHVHVASVLASGAKNAELPTSYIATGAARNMNAMLRRGFTTVRDAGGADYGLVQALEHGLIDGPRLFISGKALSQTAGHGDFRGVYDERNHDYFTRRLGAVSRLCDGIDAIRRAAREEIKAGASFIKVMANGGVASPSDPIDFLQFSIDELKAVVEEARNARTYVAAHLYHDEAIRRAIEVGISSIEHCNLVTPQTAAMIAERKAIACPTLVTHFAMADEARSYGLASHVVEKTRIVRDAGVNALTILKEAGVTMALGTDLLGPMQRRQSEEFTIRSRVLPAIDIIRAATINGAKLLRKTGELGEISVGAHADMIAVRGNPLDDITLLSEPERNFSMIMKGGALLV
jgi:imidazolonepropionase-like amidohydrolase